MLDLDHLPGGIQRKPKSQNGEYKKQIEMQLKEFKQKFEELKRKAAEFKQDAKGEFD